MSKSALFALSALSLASVFDAVPAASAAAQSAHERVDAAAFADAPDWMRNLYRERGYAPVWSDGVRPNRAFSDLVSALRAAEARGVDLSRYTVASAEALRRAEPAERERNATRIFADFALDLIEGRTSPEIEYQPGFEELRDRQKGELARAAFGLENPLDHLDQVTPDNFLVEHLTDALAEYRLLAARGGWNRLTSQDDLLIEEGDEHPLVPDIRERLAAEGFLRPLGEDDVFDSRLVAALKAFQRSRSIMDDGVVGPSTIAALNETPEELIERLEINIERARWLPTELGDKAAFVNAADYTLRLYENGAKVGEMAVIVGEERTQTPIFADTMETVVVNPYWNVPYSILTGEIAPKQVEDPSYITSNDFEVLVDEEVVSPASVDWEAAAAGEASFRVRQTAGDHNALGRIKFLFPNKYAVYLHDTPADSLFDRDIRTFSHGCIRVEEPLRFGAWLLDETESELAAMIRSEERIEIETPPVPVYITYFTAWAEPDGDVTFARDVYERDAQVLARLEG